jgi:hypothetical protein
MIQHAANYVKQVSERTNVSGGTMLGDLLMELHSVHQLGGVRGFAGQSAVNRSTVFDDIKLMMTFAGKTEPPISLLDTLDMIVSQKIKGVRDNIKSAAEEKLDSEEGSRKLLSRLEALREVIRATMNNAVQTAMELRIDMDQRAKQKGHGPVGVLKGSHAEKFAGLEQLISESGTNGVKAVMIHAPQVLGDTYDEMIVNLNRVAEAELAVVIVPPNERVGDITT